VKERQQENEQPAQVSREIGTMQAGEVRARWAWAEPRVWTERMLTALEKGVKGTFFEVHGLFSFVAAQAQLRQPRPG
jgi:hypothetical protein